MSEKISLTDFAGGTGNRSAYDYNPTSKIDIYDANTNLWSTSTLHTARGGLAGTAVNNKIYWAGGGIYQVLPESFSEVEIRNVSNLNTSLDCLFQPNAYFSAAIKNDKIVFFTGRGAQQNNFDIYDTSTDNWEIGVLSNDVAGGIISVNNIIYIAGAVINGNLSNQVWKLEF